MPRELDDDFARYVRARQHGLLRAAYLVCGDARLARELLQDAFGQLAVRWHRVRDDDPDAYVRRILYREAISALRQTRRESLPDMLPEIRAGGPHALATLAPRQRAVVVLRFYGGRSEADTAEVLGVSASSVRSHTRTVTMGLKDWLEHISDHVPEVELARLDLGEVDLAEAAWAVGLARRRRRRGLLVGTVGALAAAAVAATGVQLAGGPTPAPAPTTSVTTPPERTTLSDGTAYAQLPLEGRESELPHFDAGLPSVIDPHAPVVRFSDMTVPLSSVVAVYLRPVTGGYRPVAVSPDGRQFLADTVTLRSTRDRDGNEGVPLGPRAIGGGLYAFFPQPGKVVRLDLRTGAATSYAEPSPYVEDVDWTPANGELVVRGGGKVWTLDPWIPGGKVLPTAPSRYVGTSRLGVTTETGSLGITWFDPANNRQVGQRAVSSPVTELSGQTIGSAGWAASTALFDQNLTHPVIRRGNGPIYQGLVAVPLEQGRPRVLLAPESPDGQTGRFKDCCSVLGWADDRTVLLQTVGSHGSWVLAWNVVNADVYEVSRMPVDPARQPIPALAVNVGWRY